jgi:hypothetical protein
MILPPFCANLIETRPKGRAYSQSLTKFKQSLRPFKSFRFFTSPVTAPYLLEQIVDSVRNANRQTGLNTGD